MKTSRNYSGARGLSPIPWIILAALALVCAFIMSFYGGTGFVVRLICVGAGASLVYALLCYLRRYKKFYTLSNVLRRAMQISLILLAVAFTAVEIRLIADAVSDENTDAPVAVVLGAGVYGTVASAPLQSRIDAAFDWLHDNPGSKAILSGGMGSGENITEAECMRRSLAGRGVAPERMILEENSRDTYENIAFSKAILDKMARPGSRVAVITNDFHLYRARTLMADAGYAPVGVMAETPLLYIKLGSYVREFFSVAVMWLGL